MSLPEALERAASALPRQADAVRPANGDPEALLDALSAADGARVLAWLLEHEAHDAAELAEAWAGDPRGREVLAAVSEEALPKAGRKALRRVRHRLRSRGLVLPAEERAEPVVARLPDVGDRLDLAFVSGLDPRGSRLVYLVESRPAGGARLFEAVIDARRGVLDFEVYQAGRSQARRFVRDLQRRARLSACEVEPAEARALVGRAARRQAPDRPLPASFSEWRSHVTGEPGSQTPGDRVARELGSERTPALERRAAELVQSGELGPWPASREALEAEAERLKQAGETKLELTDAQRRLRLDELVGEAAGRLLVGEAAADAAALLRESAYVLWREDREEDARACLAAAASLETEAPGETPAARALAEAQLRPALGELLAASAPPEEAGADEEGGEGETPALITRP